MESIIAIVPALVGLLVGAGLQYVLGRAAESRRQLMLQRTQAYIDYFKAMATSAQTGRNKDTLGAAADAKVRICMYGSAAVVRKLNLFEALGAAVSSPQSRAAIADLIQEMREDSGATGTKIEQGDLLPILFGPERS